MNKNQRKKNRLTNYKVRLFSLLSAILLWFFVVTDLFYEHTINVDLELSNKPEGMVLVNPIPEKVKVRFRGRGQSLIKLYFRSKHIEVDLHQRKTTANIPLTIDMIKDIPQDRDFEPVSIVEPDSLKIQLDRFIQKKVPVYSKLNFIPKRGYVQVGEVILKPDSVIISGPMSLVDQIKNVNTAETEYEEVFKKIHGKVPLIREFIETVDYFVKTVNFETDIQRIHEVVVSDIPVIVTNVPRNVKVSVIPTTLSIRLQGGVEVLKQLDKNAIQATIDYRRSRKSEKRIPATINVPKDISFSDVKPQKFELLVER